MIKLFKIIASAIVAGSLFMTTVSAAGLSGAPAPFDKRPVNIAVISFLGSGDWLRAFEARCGRRVRRAADVRAAFMARRAASYARTRAAVRAQFDAQTGCNRR